MLRYVKKLGFHGQYICMPVANELIGSVYIYIYTYGWWAVIQLFHWVTADLVTYIEGRSWGRSKSSSRISASLQFQRSNPNRPASRSLENQITSNLGSNIFFSMVFPWFFYGCSMVFSMVVPWFFYGCSMVFLWFFHGFSMVVPWFFYVFFHRFSMVMVFLWFFHGFSIVFPLFFYGFAMFFHGVSGWVRFDFWFTDTASWREAVGRWKFWRFVGDLGTDHTPMFGLMLSKGWQIEIFGPDFWIVHDCSGSFLEAFQRTRLFVCWGNIWTSQSTWEAQSSRRV